MTAITEIVAREILDSRGNPTVEVDVRLEDGSFGRAAVPSGASTGAHEAMERRDGGPRFGGKGVERAVEAVNREIFDAIGGMDAEDQARIDGVMRTLDGTEDKHRLGAASFREALRAGAEIFHTLKASLVEAGHNTNVGDEGGFAPALKSADEALGFAVKAIEKAGYRPGDDVALALDPASTEFFKSGKYVLEGEGRTLDVEAMAKVYGELCRRYPII